MSDPFFLAYTELIDELFQANGQVALAIDDPTLRAGRRADRPGVAPDRERRAASPASCCWPVSPEASPNPPTWPRPRGCSGRSRRVSTRSRQLGTGRYQPAAEKVDQEFTSSGFTELAASAIADRPGAGHRDDRRRCPARTTRASTASATTVNGELDDPSRRAARRVGRHPAAATGARRPWPSSWPSSSPGWCPARSPSRCGPLTQQAKAMADRSPARRGHRHPRHPARRRRHGADGRTGRGEHPRRGVRRRRRPQHGAGLGPRPGRRAGRAAPQHRRQLRQPRPPQPEPARPPARLHHRARIERDRRRHAVQPVPARPPRHPHAPQRRVAARAGRHRTAPPVGGPGAAHRRHPRRSRRGRGLPAGDRAGRRAGHHHRLRRRRPGPPPRRADRERPRVLPARPDGRHPGPQPAGPSGDNGPATRWPSSTRASACRPGTWPRPTGDLAGEESFTVAPSKYLGHYVAGNLAARHDIRVHARQLARQRRHRHARHPAGAAHHRRRAGRRCRRRPGANRVRRRRQRSAPRCPRSRSGPHGPLASTSAAAPAFDAAEPSHGRGPVRRARRRWTGLGPPPRRGAAHPHREPGLVKRCAAWRRAGAGRADARRRAAGQPDPASPSNLPRLAPGPRRRRDPFGPGRRQAPRPTPVDAAGPAVRPGTSRSWPAPPHPGDRRRLPPSPRPRRRADRRRERSCPAAARGPADAGPVGDPRAGRPRAGWPAGCGARSCRRPSR